MRAYGVRKSDAGCCGGHDKHPPPCLRYNSQKRRSSAFRRKDRSRKKRARQSHLLTNIFEI